MTVYNVLAVDLLNSMYNLFHTRNPTPEWKFINDLRRIMVQWNIHKVILCCDTGSSKWRLERYPQYKEARRARREALPEEDKEAMSKFFKTVEHFKEMSAIFGFERAAIYGVEADDILSYFATGVDSGTYRCAILSSDSDIFQMLRPGVMQRAYTDKMKLLDIELPQQVWVTEERFIEAYGITPKQYMEAKSISGDIGDSIYSSHGMGTKTATKLIQKYGSIEGVKENLHDLDVSRFSGRAKEEFINNFDLVYRNMELISLLHTPEKFQEILTPEGVKQLEEIKERIPEAPEVNEEAIKEYLFSNGKVGIYNDFDNWVKPFLGR